MKKILSVSATLISLAFPLGMTLSARAESTNEAQPGWTLTLDQPAKSSAVVVGTVVPISWTFTFNGKNPPANSSIVLEITNASGIIANLVLSEGSGQATFGTTGASPGPYGIVLSLDQTNRQGVLAPVGKVDTATVNVIAPIVASAKETKAGMLISWNSVSNMSYKVQYVNAFSPNGTNSWSDLTTSGTATSTNDSFMDPIADHRYYRVVLVND